MIIQRFSSKFFSVTLAMSIWNDFDDLPMPDGQAFSQESTRRHLVSTIGKTSLKRLRWYWRGRG